VNYIERSRSQSRKECQGGASSTNKRWPNHCHCRAGNHCLQTRSVPNRDSGKRDRCTRGVERDIGLPWQGVPRLPGPHIHYATEWAQAATSRATVLLAKEETQHLGWSQQGCQCYSSVPTDWSHLLVSRIGWQDQGIPASHRSLALRVLRVW
jgi:hypothetical protein